MVYRALISLISIVTCQQVLAAACCGGGTGASALIFSDHRARFMSSYENIAYIYDVDSKGTSTKRTLDEEEVVEKMNLSASYLTDSFWQYSMSSSINKVSRRSQTVEESTTLLGDKTLTLGHEFMPEMYYSEWKPRGFVYTSLSLPTGNSKYETQKPIQTDVSGSGLYTSKLGLSFFKINGSFDFLFDINISGYFPAEVGDKDVSREPSISTQLSLGYSPNLGNLRFGAGAAYTYDGEITVNGIETPISKLISVNFASSYMLGDYTGTLVYRDDTLFSKNKNTTLARSYLISFSKSLPL